MERDLRMSDGIDFRQELADLKEKYNNDIW